MRLSGSLMRRQVTPIVARLRDALNGRKTVEHNRYHKELAPKDPIPANLPGGPSHLLSANYYCNRDGRREKEAPMIMNNHSQRLFLSSGTGSLPVVPGMKFAKAPRPGTHYDPYCDTDREAYLEVGDRDTPWEEYNASRKYNKPDA